MIDIEIARRATLQPIAGLAKERLGLGEDRLIPFGRHKAKVIPEEGQAARGKLILVTAISPTPAGEGKTTTTVGLGDGLNRLGKKAAVCLREPSLGPSFGMKGGAAGGGYAQVVPMDEINLHFTGDFHAIGAANNLLSAMTALLKDALLPNLVQTLEQTPAFVHGGPFANIAHGCNSVIATQTALGLSDYVVTEAGFGADLGAEKFFNIKCRKAGLTPRAAVVVATIRALKYHGGVARKDLEAENPGAVTAGFANLRRHLENIAKFGVPAIVVINAFDADTDAERETLRDLCDEFGVPCVLARHWAEGGKGAEDLARAVVSLTEEDKESAFAPLYPDDLSLEEKIRAVAREIYRADDLEMTPAVERQLRRWDQTEAARFPVCLAKTPYSFSADPDRRGAASGFTLPVTSVRLSAGAGFVVALTGEVMTMPGLPRVPAAEHIDVDEAGEIVGLS